MTFYAIVSGYPMNDEDDELHYDWFLTCVKANNETKQQGDKDGSCVVGYEWVFTVDVADAMRFSSTEDATGYLNKAYKDGILLDSDADDLYIAEVRLSYEVQGCKKYIKE